jgi:drebrin-like protein
MNNNTVSFQENGHEIKDTYLKIINNSEDKLKWLIITNDDKNELFVEETGESLKDFVESLKDDSAKVRYGICKTIPPGSDVEKLLFIGYCSDSLPIKYKMAFMKNLQIVRDDLFSNYHVLMEIRDESDLSYEAISKRLGDAAGARYSIQTGNSKGTLLHSGSSVKLPQKVIPSKSFSKTPSASESFKKPSPLPKKASSPPQPVKAPSPAPVPAPKKPSPVPAPKKASPVPPVRKETVEPPKLSVPPAKEESDDEDGWSEPPLEEKEIGHKGSHTTSSWKPIGKVDLKKVIAEEKAKEDPRLVKEKAIPGFVAKRKIPTPEPEEVKVESEDEADLIDAEPVAEVVNIDDEKVQSDPEVVEIEDDEKDQSEPEVVKDEVESEKEEDEIVKETSPEVKTESDRKADIEAYLSKMSKKSGTSSHGLKKAEVETKEATPEAKPPTLPSRSTNSVSSFTPEIIKPKPAVKTRASEEFEDEVKVSKSNIKKYGVPLPGLHVEEPEEVKSEKKEESDDGWSDEDEEASEAKPEISLAKNDEKKKSPTPPSLPSRSESAVPEPKKEETRAVPPPPPARAVPAPAVESEDEVVKAKALFDYEADESNEISFAKDEVLTNIEEKYPDWWYGTNEAGESGVFPSNYVEKI